MKPNVNVRLLSYILTVLFAMVAGVLTVSASEAPKVGETAPGFTLKTLDGKLVTLNEQTAKQPVVLVVLRGWPGYQCPLCTRQVHEFISQADALAGKAQVVMVYPGPVEDLKAHAQEFLNDKQWPQNFLFVIDPDYTFTKTYGLRWDAAGETSYPSTFIIDTKGKVQFAKISKSHGGRSTASEIVKFLGELK